MIRLYLPGTWVVLIMLLCCAQIERVELLTLAQAANAALWTLQAYSKAVSTLAHRCRPHAEVILRSC